MCEYALENNDFAVISHVINHCDVYLGKALVFWYVDKPEFQMIPNKDDLFSNANVLYLKNLISLNTEENDTHIKTILSNAVSPSIQELQLRKKILYIKELFLFTIKMVEMG